MVEYYCVAYIELLNLVEKISLFLLFELLSDKDNSVVFFIKTTIKQVHHLIYILWQLTADL